MPMQLQQSNSTIQRSTHSAAVIDALEALAVMTASKRPVDWLNRSWDRNSTSDQRTNFERTLIGFIQDLVPVRIESGILW